MARVARTLAHRGPDGWASYADSEIALAHTRLSIIDPSPAGAQPMRSANGKHLIVFNGEIYNFRELRSELEARGVVFRGASDTEVLLEAYALLGTGVLDRLNGIFAFAVADLERRELLVARDHFGVKPLYWSEGPFGFAFASEIKALLSVAPIERELDAAAIRRYLTFLWCPGPRTPLTAVRKLEPGCAMIVAGGRITRAWRYWTPPKYEPRRNWTIDACAEELREAVDRAVSRQMVSDAPVGALLSGGVDSTAIVAAARRSTPGLQCFTMRMGSGARSEMDDDLQYARCAARELGVPLDEITIEPRDIVGNIFKMIADLDEPLADPACLNLFFMSKAARDKGVKVLLSGIGGDDLMSGYRRHSAARFNHWLGLAPRWARAALARKSRRKSRSTPLLRRATKLFDTLDEDTDTRLMRLFAWTPAKRLDDILDRQRFAGDSPDDIWSDFEAELAQDPAAPDLEKCLRLDRRFFLADHNLLYADKMGMAAGVEIRVPLLDLDLAALASRIPAEWKHRGLTAKWMFKHSQHGLVPAGILDRPKRGFGVPLREWMRSDMTRLRDDLLSPECIAARGLFDARAVVDLLRDNDLGKVDATYTLFSMICVEAWCRRFLDDVR